MGLRSRLKFWGKREPIFGNGRFWNLRFRDKVEMVKLRLIQAEAFHIFGILLSSYCPPVQLVAA